MTMATIEGWAVIEADGETIVMCCDDAEHAQDIPPRDGRTIQDPNGNTVYKARDNAWHYARQINVSKETT